MIKTLHYKCHIGGRKKNGRLAVKRDHLRQ